MVEAIDPTVRAVRLDVVDPASAAAPPAALDRPGVRVNDAAIADDTDRPGAWRTPSCHCCPAAGTRGS